MRHFVTKAKKLKEVKNEWLDSFQVPMVLSWAMLILSMFNALGAATAKSPAELQPRALQKGNGKHRATMASAMIPASASHLCWKLGLLLTPLGRRALNIMVMFECLENCHSWVDWWWLLCPPNLDGTSVIVFDVPSVYAQRRLFLRRPVFHPTIWTTTSFLQFEYPGIYIYICTYNHNMSKILSMHNGTWWWLTCWYCLTHPLWRGVGGTRALAHFIIYICMRMYTHIYIYTYTFIYMHHIQYICTI